MENARKKLLLINGSEVSLLAGLKQEGYEVTVCEPPQKAWGFVFPIRPHFIILHLEQPNNSDVYAVQECRALADGVPLIIATGESRIEAIMKELGEGAPPFLSVPLKPNAVKEILHGLEFSTNERRPTSRLKKQF